MIIRIIGDNWVPEDKVLISVREDDEVKSSLPNIMKKLAIKRIGDYKLYFTIGERKCDYRKLINSQSTWKELGLSSGSIIYLSKKEPDFMEESLGENNKNNDINQQQEEEVNIPKENLTKQKVDNILSDTQNDTKEGNDHLSLDIQLPKKSHTSHIAVSESKFVEEIPHFVERSLLQVSEPKPQPEPNLPPKLYRNELKNDSSYSNNLYVDKNTKNQKITSPMNSIKPIQENHFVNKEKENYLVSSTNSICRSNNLPQMASSIVPEVRQLDEVENSIILRRCERTAYVVSLYEFAHLEFQRQRRRAEELRREIQEELPRPHVSTPKLLYRI